MCNDFPKDWQLKTLAQVCTSTSSNITFKNIQDKKGDYPIYGASGVVSYVDFYTKESQSLGIVKDGAGIGRVFLLPPKASVIGTLHYVESNDDVNLKYLFYFLQSINLARYITGSAIPHIYFRDWKKEQIPIPPLEIQRRIVKRLDEAFSRIESGTKHLKSAKDNLTKYKQSLLKSAFNGTLTQDCPLSLGESTAESSLRENPQGFLWQSTNSLSQGESTHLTHPLAPSAREGEREDSPRTREGEQENCHTDSIHCHTERSEVSHQNNVDSSVSSSLKNDNDRNNLKVPSLCGGDLGVGSTRTHNVVDCHESANADSRNDENSPSFVGGQSSSPSLARGGGDSESSPSLAEGARGWVNPCNDDKHCHTKTLSCHTEGVARSIQKENLQGNAVCLDSSVATLPQNDKEKRHYNDDKDTLNGESANLPQGWTIKTLGKIAHTTSGGTPSRKNLDYWNGNIKWLKSGELNDDYINEAEESITQIGLEKSSAKIFPKGTLLIALYGATIGKLGILNIETATNQAICAITPNKDFEVKYLFHFLFSIREKMIQDAFGGAQSNISQTYLKQLKIPIPPLETQKQIVAILDGHFTSADKVSAYIESCLSKAKQLKSSLLKSAFDGTLANESTHPLAPSAREGE